MKSTVARLLALWLVAAAGCACAADVGGVLLAAGAAVAIRNNQPIKLTLGSAVQNGDVLRTGAASNLQVRFSDESILSLRENSELRIDEYVYSGAEDGTERAFFRLLRGGLRAVSGLIGRTNQKNFGVNSIVTNIGIRGTDFGTAICQQDCRNADGSLARDGQYGRVHGLSHGTNRIEVSNERDQKVFGINENFYAADAKSIVEPLLVPPDFVASRLESRKRGGSKEAGGSGSEKTAEGEERQDSRATTDVPPGLSPLAYVATEERTASGGTVVSGDSDAMRTIGGVGAFFQNFQTDPSDGGGFFRPSELTTDPPGAASNLAIPQKLVGFVLPPGFSGGQDPNRTTTSASASSSAAVIDETVANPINAHWGRWTSGSFTDDSGTTSINPNNQFHYLYGPLTPYDVIASKTGSFPMNNIGGTTPTNQAGQTGTFNAGAVSVNFSARTVTFPASTFTFAANAWTFNAATAAIQRANAGGAFIDSISSGTCTGGVCTVGVPATLGRSGIFMGPRGDHLGVAFHGRTNSGTASAQTTRLFSCAPAGC